MNAGKTTALLQANFNYHERGMTSALFTAAINDRDGRGVIKSRIGLLAESHVFEPHTDLFEYITDLECDSQIDCVFVDEAQFLSGKQVSQLARIADERAIPVMCFGLRTDFQGELFEGSARLLAIADDIRELKTICHCGKKATMNLRIDANGTAMTSGERVEVGGNDRYTAMCRKHFLEALNRAEKTRP